MPKFTFKQRKEIGQTFLAYQHGQPGGLPSTYGELNICYDNFCALTPGERPPFSSVFIPLKAVKLIGVRRGGELFYPRRLAVDHNVAARAHDSAFFCEVCRLPCQDANQLEEHMKGRRHKTMERVRELLAGKDESEKDKGGISINKVDFGVVQVGNVVYRVFTITNSGASRRTLLACEFVQKLTSLQLSDRQHVTSGLRTHIIAPGQTYNITLTCTASNLGYIRDVLIFRFQGFNINRYITIHVDAPDSKELGPSAPYRRRPPVTIEEPSNIVPGIPLERLVSEDSSKKLPLYNIPDELRRDTNRGEAPRLAPLAAVNYVKYFSTLLFVEEIQMNVDIRQYDLKSPLGTSRQYYNLEVPGLAENRPSVLRGDSVYVRIETTEYEGVVHRVELAKVHLLFNSKFDSVFRSGQQYQIRFSFKRGPLKRMHEAVNKAQRQLDPNHYPILPPLLFPSDNLSPTESNNKITQILEQKERIAPINRTLNTQQMRAVAAIMIGSARPCPYIVFGPPGTGKTMTLVEAIGQIYRTNPEARILACAPSNNASDLLAKRLLDRGVMPKDIYRFNAYNRPYDDLAEEVKPISSYHEDTGNFAALPKAVIARKKIVVSTCINAGNLYTVGITPFTHVFVDEAGQAMEPECLVCLTGLVLSTTTVVLAGDPKQLGPVIRSPFAQKNGTGLIRSLLERIIGIQPYQRDVVNYAAYGNYNIRLITKLVNNYRSHPEILLVPNKLFYDDELVPMADEVGRTMMCNWEHLPRKGFPMMFHGIEGKDDREENSPSWFNADECVQVFDYVKKIMANRAPKLNASDIGVITPYRKQAEKIRKLFQAKMGGGIMVGSVEQFQGQERSIIIISCVRSNNEHIEFDCKHNLGFLKNPKRFNVAITRPKALLIIIGNPRVLVNDPNWAFLLWHIVDHGGYRGCDLPPRDPSGSMEQLIDVFDRLRVGEDEDTETMEAEDQEWRRPN